MIHNCVSYVERKKSVFLIFYTYLFQAGSDTLINSASPVNSKNQTKRWLLFNRDIVNPPQSDVSDQHYPAQASFVSAYSCMVNRV